MRPGSVGATGFDGGATALSDRKIVHREFVIMCKGQVEWEAGKREMRTRWEKHVEIQAKTEERENRRRAHA